MSVELQLNTCVIILTMLNGLNRRMCEKGSHSNIMEIFGEHDSIIFLFNQPIKKNDAVCLPLHERVDPKFVPNNDSMVYAGTQKTIKLDSAFW